MIAYDTDIIFSPKGTYVSFIRGENIFVLNINNGKEKKLTKDVGRNNIKNGISEFVAQEEIDRMTSY